jgi:hypothetical protein
MIHFNAETRTFALQLETTFYAFQVDPEGRLLHLAWGPWPRGAEDMGPSGWLSYDLFELPA